MLDFEKRKRDHIDISLSAQSQSGVPAGFERVEMIHEALPDLNFSDINIQTSTLGLPVSSPFFVSSMTLGHMGSEALNSIIASVCEERNILMAVGSQRRQLTDPTAAQECRRLRKEFPRLKLLGNIGLSQLIQSSTEEITELIHSLAAQGLIIHTNPLQECIQPEGTPQFRGGKDALERICQSLDVPVILKETGCGFSLKTLESLRHSGLSAVDISGRGGTHWGRVETERAGKDSVQALAGQTFRDWGISTVESTHQAAQLYLPFEVWSSGGVRSGLDGAKLIAMGAHMVGIARPVLQEALRGKEFLQKFFDVLDYELKVAMFCSGVDAISRLRTERVWKWI
ncbi:MAG: type 2 isopentenyl-diphosphate Delta-isomerase [Bdellovibrionaceae bacterium]|nr:type 2 isopentenyl-diphosphate Delta-isomerase [Pseudobdellovibrionaceae bacterium]